MNWFRGDHIAAGEFKKGLCKALELPPDLLMDLPRVTILGNKRFSVENYRGLIECSSTRISVGFARGQILLRGEGLNILSITQGELIVEGQISSIEFQG
ncbi:MAG: sporulation protein YqfC [Bacillota bacterium]